ncbi:hypothetical protein EJ08DRAFT_44963 [Tothia fuscella]|uniref:Uncharacterized protein n=1 Tax=Tothia fuscella TaxID=1048955 RepID=A0A9P4NFF9_9PEZI|nr:hypothetical protein EJ08DRAFT_44963 [Tothia fuscella]
MMIMMDLRAIPHECCWFVVAVWFSHCFKAPAHSVEHRMSIFLRRPRRFLLLRYGYNEVAFLRWSWLGRLAMVVSTQVGCLIRAGRLLE